VPEERYLVNARLARDGAGRRALKSVAREYACGRCEKKLPCRGAPAGSPGWGFHASAYLHIHGTRIRVQGPSKGFPLQREPNAQQLQPVACPMMAPVIILGALMMFVFWDTSDRH